MSITATEEQVLKELKEEKSKAKSAARRKKKTSQWLQKGLRLVRRTHLYSGLFMFPWVILYGFTALLFNRPTTFPDTEVVHFSLAETAAEDGANSVPAALAAEIVDRLNQQAAEQAAPDGPVAEFDLEQRFRLVDPSGAMFTSRASWQTTEDETRYTLVTDLNKRNGYVRIEDQTPPGDAEEEGPDEDDPLGGISALTIDATSVAETIELAAQEYDDERPLDFTSSAGMRVPTLEFDIEIDGVMHRARFSTDRNQRPTRGGEAEANHLKSGRISLVGSNNNDRPMSWRRYLLRLHTAHGYPLETNARWVWAVIVDIMFASMVFWGLSGMVMWWQIKRTRRWGAITVILSALCAFAIAYAMHTEMTGG